MNVVLRKDCLPPVLAIAKPANDTTSAAAVAFEVSAVDAQLDKVWYTVGPSGAKYFVMDTAGEVDANAWAAVADGEVLIYFHANDTLGNEVIQVAKIIKQASQGGGPDPFLGVYLGAGAIIAVVAVFAIVKIRKR